MTLTVSVIIPAIDEAEVIEAAVESARHAGADEVIVADGGSADDTVERARHAGAHALTVPCGRGRQQNSGAAAATGDVLLFLHADCCLPQNGLDGIRDRLSGSDASVGGYFRQRIDASGGLYRWIESGNWMRARVLGWAYGDQAIFVRASVFEQIGGFPDLPLMEDLYLMKRLKRQGQLIGLDATLQVSARRWKQRGAIRQTLRNWMMLAAVHLGVSPGILARFYPRAT